MKFDHEYFDAGLYRLGTRSLSINISVSHSLHFITHTSHLLNNLTLLLDLS